MWISRLLILSYEKSLKNWRAKLAGLLILAFSLCCILHNKAIRRDALTCHHEGEKPRWNCKIPDPVEVQDEWNSEDGGNQGDGNIFKMPGSKLIVNITRRLREKSGRFDCFYKTKHAMRKKFVHLFTMFNPDFPLALVARLIKRLKV